MAIITDANIPTTGIGGPSPAPDYTPPSIIWKDADEIYVPKGRYYKAGYRFGGQYQDLSNLSAYWDVADRFAVDVDATYSAGSTSGMLGGKVNSSWYSVFMVDSDEILLLPFLRVDVIGYSSGDGYTAINPASQADGTTAENGFLTADNQFNGYRLVLINDDPTESGNVYTILDSGDYTPDGIAISGDVSSQIAATEGLQMLPPSGIPSLFLGTVFIDSGGNLRWFSKTGWTYQIKPAPNINGVKGGTPGLTDLWLGIPPTAHSMRAKPYAIGTAKSVGSTVYFGSSGTDRAGQTGFYINEGTALEKNTQNTITIPITVPGQILNNFYLTSGGSPTEAFYEIYEYSE